MSQCLTVGAVIVIPGCHQSGIKDFIDVVHQGVPSAEFSFTEPIPQASPGCICLPQEEFMINVWLALIMNTWPLTLVQNSSTLAVDFFGDFCPVVLSSALVDPSGWETHGGESILFPPNKSLTCPLYRIHV